MHAGDGSQVKTLVLSPLKALIRDQVDSINKMVGFQVARAIEATDVSGMNDADLKMEILEAKHERLLYMSYEKLVMSKTLQTAIEDLLAAKRLGSIVFDESHIIPESKGWRETVQKAIKWIQQELPRASGRPRIIAVTATATPDRRKTIKEVLGIKDNVAEFVTTIYRSNLEIRICYKFGIADDFKYLIDERTGDDGKVLPKERRKEGIGLTLIYASKKAECDLIVSFLIRKGLTAVAHYRKKDPKDPKADAKKEDAKMKEAFHHFMQGSVDFVVATESLGLGVDNPHVREVIVYGAPDGIERYQQKIGRAGRDGEPARATMFFAPGNMCLYEKPEGDPKQPAQKAAKKSREMLKELVEHDDCCRWATLRRLCKEPTPEGWTCRTAQMEGDGEHVQLCDVRTICLNPSALQPPSALHSSTKPPLLLQPIILSRRVLLMFPLTRCYAGVQERRDPDDRRPPGSDPAPQVLEAVPRFLRGGRRPLEQHH